MYLKTSNKKQLAAAVTLAVMGTAWVAVPSQVWADSAQIGSGTTPVTWEYYKNDSGSEISDNRADKSGASVFAAQYHQNFNDNQWAAFGDMGGKTLTISGMSVEAIQGKDGVGAAAGDTVKEGSFGQAGGLASVYGVYSTQISNAMIKIADNALIEAKGGKTYSEAMTAGGVFQHQGGKGIDGNTDATLNGGEGAKGGVGGKAIATGVDLGNGTNISISGGALSVSAKAEAGGHGGYGGAGGTGADGAELGAAKADKGADGSDGEDKNTTPAKAANGADKTVHAANGTTNPTHNASSPPAQTGWASTAGSNGEEGNVGSIGTKGDDGGDANDGAKGTDGIAGTTGLTGGAGGAGAAGGDGGNAASVGLRLKNISGSSVTLTSLTVDAAAGNGTAGGEGGIGGTGGVGGAGQTGGDGGNGGQGGDGAKGGDGGDGGRGQSGGAGVDYVASNGGWSISATVGGNGGKGGAGGVGGVGGDAGDGGDGGAGGVGGVGGVGGAGGTGGTGGNGGAGGVAVARGLMSTANTDLNITIGTITVTATGGNGAKAGIGGAGGDGGQGGIGGQGGTGGTAGAAGTAGVGGTGGKGGVGGTGGIGGAQSNGVHMANGTDGVTGDPGNKGTDGALGIAGDAGKGGSAGKGGHGGAGGTAGTAGTSGIGNDASAMAVVLKDTTGVLKTGSITATAVAGKGVGSFSAADAYLLGNSTGDPHDNRKAVTDGAGKDGTDGATVTETDKTQAAYQNGAVNATSNGGEGGGGITPTGTIAQTGNGEKAIAAGLVTTNGTLNVVSDAGLAISAEAKDASVNNEAYAVSAAESDNAYVVKGDFKITAKATGDVDLTTAATTSNPKFEYKANQTSTTSIAKAFVINGGSMLADIDGKLEIEAAADKGEAKNWAQGMAVDNAAVQVHTTDAISIKATAAIGAWQGAQGIEGNNNDLTFVSDAGGIKVTALGGNSTNLQKEYAVWLYDSSLTLDAKDAEAGIELNGDVEVVTNKTSNSTLNLKSNTKVNGNASDIGGSSKGTLNITGTTMNLTDNLKTLTVADKTTLKGSTVYFYDENNQADKYNTADYRTITTKDLDASGTNELFMRTNANGVYGQSAGNDKIISTNTATGSGTYNITVFDQGMRNGYNNAAGAANKGHLNADVVLIDKAQATGQNGATYNIKEMKYDNGVWAYEYEGKAEIVNNGLNLTQVTTKAAAQSSAQMAAQDANKIAAGAAVTLFGADETLMERLGDVRNSADDNDGVWAKYVGGKIKVDGLQGDNDYQYNGFAAGYDREIGSNWRIGLAGQYAKGDTSLTNGDGEIKTAAGALYGTWTGDKGHHVDIIAKVGKVDSETSAYGGTIAQKLDGDFGSTAISFAVEYGYRQDLNDGWFVEPMVRASYVHLGGDDYTVTTRDNTMSVTNDSMNSIVLRGGFLLGKTFAADSSVYLKAAVLHDFDGEINTHVSADGRSASYSDSIGGTAIEYGIGVNHKFNKDSSMYLDVERISGGDVTKNWGVNVGFRYSF